MIRKQTGSRRTACEQRSRSLLMGLFTALAAAVAALAIAACGSSTSTAVVGTDAAGARGETLTIATPSSPPSLDPATGANEYSDYFNLAYEPLIIEAPDGSFGPGLATSWKYGPRNESFSIELRPHVQFSDGTALDAAAVKTWIEYEMKLPGGRAPTYLESLKSIEVEGPLALTIHFSSPTPVLEQVFSQTFEMGMIGSPKATKGGSLKTSTAGAGPYMLDSGATISGSEYVYVPNPHYWNKANVHWNKVVIKTIANPSAALQALRTGQIQVAKDQPSTTLSAAEAAGVDAVKPLTLLLGLSLMDREGKVAKPLGDPKVRQALNYAIDREAIAGVIGAGSGRPIAQMAVPGDDSYDPALEDRYPYDPEKAKELLAEAGYPNGFSLKALSLTLVGQDQMAQAIAAQLEEVGVKLELDVKSDIGDYFNEMGSGSYPVATLSFGRVPAAIDYKLLWGPNAVPFNPFGTKSAKLAALDRELSAAPEAQAAAIAKQMQAYTVDEAWFVPVVATPLVVLHSDEVTGVTATPQRSVIYTTEIAPAG
jgi:peptide/nickel transport system substrate-binding protein